jgi:hypothetical protein
LSKRDRLFIIGITKTYSNRNMQRFINTHDAKFIVFRSQTISGVKIFRHQKQEIIVDLGPIGRHIDQYPDLVKSGPVGCEFGLTVNDV